MVVLGFVSHGVLSPSLACMRSSLIMARMVFTTSCYVTVAANFLLFLVLYGMLDTENTLQIACAGKQQDGVPSGTLIEELSLDLDQ